jgi:hypothetical protein
MDIPFDSGVSINQLRYGAGFGCSALTPPSANGPQGYLFLANTPLNLDPQNPCINVDGTAPGSSGDGITLIAADNRTAGVHIVSFSGVDQAGNSFSGHFELVRYPEATAGFRAVLAEDPADVAARHYIDRLLEIARTRSGQARHAGISVSSAR